MMGLIRVVAKTKNKFGTYDLVVLLDQKRVFEILCCPKTGNRLKKVDNRLISESGEVQTEYDIVNGYPVLIDFEMRVLKKKMPRH